MSVPIDGESMLRLYLLELEQLDRENELRRVALERREPRLPPPAATPPWRRLLRRRVRAT